MSTPQQHTEPQGGTSSKIMLFVLFGLILALVAAFLILRPVGQNASHGHSQTAQDPVKP